MSIEKEILDDLIPRLKKRSVKRFDRMMEVFGDLNEVLITAVKEENEKGEVPVNIILLLAFLRTTLRMIQDNKIYLETVEQLLAKHEERWQEMLKQYQKQREPSEARIQEIWDKTEKYRI